MEHFCCIAKRSIESLLQPEGRLKMTQAKGQDQQQRKRHDLEKLTTLAVVALARRTRRPGMLR